MSRQRGIQLENTVEVERLDGLAVHAFRERYLGTSRPVHVLGGVKDWPALKKWNPDFFRCELGDLQLKVELRKDERSQSAHFVTMSMSEYLDRLGRSEDQYYFSDVDLRKAAPRLVSDIPRPSYLQEVDDPEPIIWFGRDSFTAMHYHPDKHAMLCQAVGHKRVVLYSPEVFHHLYPEPWYSPRFNWSRIDFSQPIPHDRFANLAKATAFEANLAPGDLLFIPLHWWHVVSGPDLSISVSFFWDAPLMHAGFPTPGIRTLAGNWLATCLYEPLSRIPKVQDFYFQLRRRRGTDRGSGTARGA